MKKLERLANLTKEQMEAEVLEAYNNRCKIERREKLIEKLMIFLFFGGIVVWFALIFGLAAFLKN